MWNWPLRPFSGQQTISSGGRSAHYGGPADGQTVSTTFTGTGSGLPRRGHAARRELPDGRALVEVQVARPCIFRDADGIAWEFPIGVYQVEDTLADHWYFRAHRVEAVTARGGQVAQPYMTPAGFVALAWMPPLSVMVPGVVAYTADCEGFPRLEAYSHQMLWARRDANGIDWYNFVSTDLEPQRHQPLPPVDARRWVPGDATPPVGRDAPPAGISYGPLLDVPRPSGQFRMMQQAQHSAHVAAVARMAVPPPSSAPAQVLAPQQPSCAPATPKPAKWDQSQYYCVDPRQTPPVAAAAPPQPQAPPSASNVLPYHINAERLRARLERRAVLPWAA